MKQRVASDSRVRLVAHADRPAPPSAGARGRDLAQLLENVIGEIEELESTLEHQRGFKGRTRAAHARRREPETVTFAAAIETTTANLRQALRDLRRIERRLTPSG